MPKLTPIPEGMEIKKLPDGRAQGADDLTDWSHGLSGGNRARQKIFRKNKRDAKDLLGRVKLRKRGKRLWEKSNG